MELLNYTLNTSSHSEIKNHLERCNNLFEPSLDTYLDINAYSQKLFEKSFCFEVKNESRLIGLVAVYFGVDRTFISNFSIEKEWMRKGVSKELMKKVISASEDRNLNCICLEVFEENKRAVKFYSKYGFVLKNENKNKLTLCKSI